MREVNLAGLDLNLLPPLEALLRRRNVSLAAQDVGLSQPAMSNALARLRDLLGDPLLVRAAGGYALTPRAQALAGRLLVSLDHVKSVFQSPEVNPAQVRRTFRIAGADTHSIILAPALMARLTHEAPHVSIRIESYRPDIVRQMETGAIDLTFATSTTPLPPGSYSESYATDRLALVMRRGHRLARRKVRIEDYADVPHASVSIFGDSQSDLDAELARHGVNRHIALTTPHFMAALAAVAATDMVTTISRVFAQRFADYFDLVLKEPPLQNVDLDLTLVWSEIRSADPVLAWLRGVISEVARATMHLPKPRRTE